MHIEPGVIDAAKMALGTATATGAAAYTVKKAAEELTRSNILALAARTLAATVGTFVSFQILPHFVAGVSEVHFIFGTTLFLMLGAAPAAMGLALGLLLQGLFFVPTDLPMYFVNVTTILVPLFAIDAAARRIIPAGRAYVDVDYADVLKLSGIYQGGIVAWVAFWVFYGQGVSEHTLHSVLTFAAAYSVVLLVEPLADLGALAVAKTMRGTNAARLFSARLYNAA